MTNNHPHPNPKDVEAWLFSHGWVLNHSSAVDPEDITLWMWQKDNMFLSFEQAQFFYTIHHTALTSFRDELLVEMPETRAFTSAKPDPEGEVFSGDLHENDGFNEAIRNIRKAIQTISERHGL